MTLKNIVRDGNVCLSGMKWYFYDNQSYSNEGMALVKYKHEIEEEQKPGGQDMIPYSYEKLQMGFFLAQYNLHIFRAAQYSLHIFRVAQYNLHIFRAAQYSLHIFRVTQYNLHIFRAAQYNLHIFRAKMIRCSH